MTGRSVFIRHDQARRLWWMMQSCIDEGPAPHTSDAQAEADDKWYRKLQRKFDWAMEVHQPPSHRSGSSSSPSDPDSSPMIKNHS